MALTDAVEFFGMGLIFGLGLCYTAKLIQLIFDTIKKFF